MEERQWSGEGTAGAPSRTTTSCPARPSPTAAAIPPIPKPTLIHRLGNSGRTQLITSTANISAIAGVSNRRADVPNHDDLQLPRRHLGLNIKVVEETVALVRLRGNDSFNTCKFGTEAEREWGRGSEAEAVGHCRLRVWAAPSDLPCVSVPNPHFALTSIQACSVTEHFFQQQHLVIDAAPIADQESVHQHPWRSPGVSHYPEFSITESTVTHIRLKGNRNPQWTVQHRMQETPQHSLSLVPLFVPSCLCPHGTLRTLYNETCVLPLTTSHHHAPAISAIMLSSTEKTPTIPTSDLRALGRALTKNIDTYLNALSGSSLAKPGFHPGAETAIPSTTGIEGVAAQREIIDLAEQIIALTSGPAGLYGISRQVRRHKIEWKKTRTVGLTNGVFIVFRECRTTDRGGSPACREDSCRRACQCSRACGEDGRREGGHRFVFSASICVEYIADHPVRTLRALTPIYVFTECAPQVYQHSARSCALLDPAVAALMTFSQKQCLPAALHLPTQLSSSGYRLPTPTTTAFNAAFSTPLPFFAATHSSPELSALFSSAMAGTLKLSYSPHPPTRIFPFGELAGTLVDVGGGRGHVAIAIADTYPDAAIELVVQDITVSGTDPRIRWMEYDFFTAQPVRGAAAYFLRHVLHDWPDAECARILRRVVDAMEAGKSRLLLCEVRKFTGCVGAYLLTAVDGCARERRVEGDCT